jgi:chaperonin cofactor prefoldin
MEQGKYNCSRFKRTPNKRKPSSEWIITSNTHEAIINDELWHYVQNCLNTRKRVLKRGEPQLFSGFLKCPDCGYALALGGSQGIEYYSCGLYRRKGLMFCSQHYINKKVLISAVLDDIRKHAKLAESDADGLAAKLAAEYGDSEEKRIQTLTDELESVKARYAELDRIMEQLYEDKIAGRLTNGRFQKLSVKYEAEQPLVEKKLEVLKADIDRLSANRRDVSSWIESIRKYTDIQELDRIILGELVEKITVGEAKVIDSVKHLDITIYYRFVGAVSL